MWKHVLPPVVTVIVFWLIMSFATNYYISYVYRSHNRILAENVASIVAASDLRAACWRLVAARVEDAEDLTEFEARFEPYHSEMSNAVATLQSTATTLKEKEILGDINLSLLSIEKAFDERRAQLSSDKNSPENEFPPSSVQSTVVKMVSAAVEMGRHNRQFIEQEEAYQKELLTRMTYARNFSIILGPIVGVVLGWRITARLQRHVSTLAITLRNAASDRVLQVGEVAIRNAGDFKEIQKLSEQVTVQMRQTLKELERAKQEVIQSERLAAVGELAAGIAHELRNPLTSVKLLLQHALSGKNRGQLEIENMELILNEVARMEETIQGLLDFSRPTKLSSHVHDIRIPLQRAVTLVSGRAHSNGVEIKYHPDEQPLWVDGDLEQLHLVFVNIMINAVEANEDGGTIVVTTNQHFGSIVIDIRDSGHGIPADILPRVFEPFVTTKESGTGLGLALCHRVVTNHQGTIVARNQPQGGTVFRVQLPTATVAEAASLSY